MNPASFRVPHVDLSRRVDPQSVIATREAEAAEAQRQAYFRQSAQRAATVCAGRITLGASA